jgi:hypothetical protein
MRQAPVPEPGADGTRAQRSRRRPAWLGPVGATAAVALVAGVIVALALHAASRNWTVPAAPGPASTAPGPPRYYVDLEVYGQPVVRATATGAVTARPLGPCGGTSVAASADDRTFYVACWGDGGATTLYTFRLTGAGKAYGLARVIGGRALGGLYVQVMAVSPDGSQIALAGFYPDSRPGLGPPGIFVLNRRTGVQEVWLGGLAGPGSQLSISSLSWTNGGRSLVFLATWCTARTAQGCLGASSIIRGNHHAEVWALDPAAGGSTLDSGRPLLSQSARFPYIAQALISGDGRTIIAAALSGPQNEYTGLPDDLSIVRISVATGRQVGVLYRGLVKSGVNLSTDGSGQNLLLADGSDGRYHGWIYQGRIHGLPPNNGDGQVMAW